VRPGNLRAIRLVSFAAPLLKAKISKGKERFKRRPRVLIAPFGIRIKEKKSAISPFHDTCSNYINERIMFEGHRSRFVSTYTSDFLLLKFYHAVGNILFSSANILDCAKIENKKDMFRKKNTKMCLFN